jgi:hypothetical protein
MAWRRTTLSIAAPIVPPRRAQRDWLIALEKHARPNRRRAPHLKQAIMESSDGEVQIVSKTTEIDVEPTDSSPASGFDPYQMLTREDVALKPVRNQIRPVEWV